MWVLSLSLVLVPSLSLFHLRFSSVQHFLIPVPSRNSGLSTATVDISYCHYNSFYYHIVFI